LRRRHLNATQKLRLSSQIDLGEEKPRLEEEISRCASGKSSLRTHRNAFSIFRIN
jgi:hypothetical protein